MQSKFKVVTSNSQELFEQRLNAFIASLGPDDVIVDVKFATAPTGTSIEFTALVQYQHTEGWQD